MGSTQGFWIIVIIIILFFVIKPQQEEAKEIKHYGGGTSTITIQEEYYNTFALKNKHFTELKIISDTTINIPVYNNYYNITGFQQGNTYGILTDNNSYAQITKTSYYHLSISTSFSGGANTEYELEVFTNEIANENCELHRKMGTGGDVGSASITCILNLQIGDKINVKIADNTNPSNDILIHSMNFNMVEI